MFPLLPFWGLRSMLQKEEKDKLLNYAKKLRLKYTQICNGMTCTGDIVAQLFQGEVLTSKERDDIQHLLLTPVRANEQILNTLMMKEDRAFECFFTALIDTGQRHITEILINEDKCLHMEHSLTIQRNYVSLVDNLDVDSGHLLGRLYEARAVTERDISTINAMSTRHLKSEALLALVSKFSPANFEIFLQALKESSQEHVVGIITGILYAKTECNSSTSTAAVEFADFRLQETFQNNADTKGDSNHDLRDKQLQNIRHCSGMIRTSSYHAKRKSSITVGNRFTNLLDDLQNDISLKVAVLRQKTVLPPGADIEICFRKLIRGFIHLKIEVSEKHTDVEDKILRRANDSTQKFEPQFEDKFRTDLQLLNEELLLLRTNIRNLDGTLNVTKIELLHEKQKNRELERQLEKYHDESVNILQQRDKLQRQLSEEKRLRDERVMDFLTHVTDKDNSIRVCQPMKGAAKTTYQRSVEGYVAIYKCSQDGKYVAIQNIGRKVESLGGWSLTRNIAGKDSANYKLPEFCVLRPGQKVKVWAKGAKPFTGALGDFESAQNWGVGAHIITQLLNPLGEERAHHIEQRIYS